MKKMFWIMGVASLAVLALGFLFGMCHWPGGIALLVVSVALALAAFVLLCCSQTREGRLPRWLLAVGIGASAALVLGLIMQLLSLPGGRVMLILGVTLFGAATTTYILYTAMTK